MSSAATVVYSRLRGLSVAEVLRILTSRSFHFAPKFLKYFVLFLFLIQARSWPLAWHFYVWRPVFVLRGKYYLHRLSLSLSPPAIRRQKSKEYVERLSKVGMNPFDLQVTYKTWAGPDDCDYNMHLSNSSYPKHLDAARMKHALELCPTLFRVGGWMGLGATHFTFLREIPIFSRYEMRVSIMSWDNKWTYVATRFVTKLKKGKGKGGVSKKKPLPEPTPSPPSGGAPTASVHTATGLQTGSGSVSPLPPDAQAAAAQLLERGEPDGATVHCLAVSEIVCKVGRITVPPALMLAVDGFSRAPPSPSSSSDPSVSASATPPAPYSHTNPPPHMAHVRAMLGTGAAALDDTRGLRALRDFVASGWRAVPEGERWWEDALGGEVEERRLRGLGAMHALRRGLEEARTI